MPPAADDPAALDGWRGHWYPLAFSEDLGPDEVRAVSIHDQAFALFRDAEGHPRCVVDRCPHRAARLSDGRCEDGRLECLYHGWQFSGDGECVHIPQWPESQPLPSKAAIGAFEVVETQGMVWMWPGDVSENALDADRGALPSIPALDAEDCSSIDFAIDLPYEQTFLVENVIDIAHIHVAHDGVRGGGHRHLAAPIHFEVSGLGPGGFEGSFHSGGAPEGGHELRGAKMVFRAPGLVHYESLYEDDDLVSGLALYSLPLGRRRCRLLYRAYSNFWPLRTRLRPRWLEHWTQCTILEQDMDVVVGQAAEIESSGQTPAELWLPLKSSDGFVLAYRRWLDEHAADWPYSVGFRRVAKPTARADREPAVFNRLDMHTRQCASCRRAEKLCRDLAVPLLVAVVVLLAVAAVTAGTWFSAAAAALAVLAALGRVAVDRATSRFH